MDRVTVRRRFYRIRVRLVCSVDQTPLANVGIKFTANTGQFALADGGTISSSVTVYTDSSGAVSVWFFTPAQLGTSTIKATALYGPVPSRPNVQLSATTIAPLAGSDPLATGADAVSLALETDGTMWSWGQYPGDGGEQAHSYPAPLGSPQDAISVAAGSSHAALLTGDGVVWSWGGNEHGQLGDGTTAARNVAVSVLANAISVKAAGAHTLALLQDGTVAAWGENNYGQLGDGTTADRSIPVVVPSLTGVRQIAAGYQRSLALKSDGSLWTWGLEAQPPALPQATYDTQPVQISGLTNVRAISAGLNHAVAVEADGTVWAWGGNANGELGNGTFASYSATPVQVSNIGNAITVASTYDHTLALLGNGTVVAWGSNSNGQLGNGTTASSNVPVQALGLNNVIAIAAGESYSMAMKSDGSVWAWGSDNGFLGLLVGDTTKPRQVTLGILDEHGNGMDDRWEMQYFGTLNQASGGDFDGDGLSNLQEYQLHLDPTAADSDDDASSDGEEVAAGSDPNDASSYPPRPRDFGRAIDYTFTTSGWNGAPYGRWNWSASWPTAVAGSEEFTEAKRFTDLDDKLAAVLPFPAVERSPDYFGFYIAGSSSYSSILPLDQDGYTETAHVEQRLLCLHRYPATSDEAKLEAVVLTTHELDQAAQPEAARLETLTIPPGATTSNFVELLCALTWDLPTDASHTEYIDETFLPVELQQLNYPSSSGTTDLGPTRVQSIQPDGIAYITGTPEMPILQIRIGQSTILNTTVEWRMTVTSERPERGTQDDLSIPQTGVIELPLGQYWNIYDYYTPPADFFGGNCTIYFRLKYNGTYIIDEQSFAFKVRGKNPIDAEAKSYIELSEGDYRFSWAMTQHESRQTISGVDRIYNQFNAGGASSELPNFSGNYPAEDGWGIAQLDKPLDHSASTAEVYSWNANISKFYLELAQKNVTANAYFDVLRNIYEPSGVWEEPPLSYVPADCGTSLASVEAAEVQLYNGAAWLVEVQNGQIIYDGPYTNTLHGGSRYISCWQFSPDNPTGQKWSFHANQNNYVHEVIYNEFEGHESATE